MIPIVDADTSQATMLPVRADILSRFTLHPNFVLQTSSTHKAHSISQVWIS
jgi:hypothetical protein